MSHDWQRRFYAGPAVWATVYREAFRGEEISNLYESPEAATLEVEWAKRKGYWGQYLPIVRRFHIHTLELARERWEAGS